MSPKPYTLGPKPRTLDPTGYSWLDGSFEQLAVTFRFSSVIQTGILTQLP